ncbi:MAG: RNA 3'-terminal phosphate cyclase [Candidatus Hodarchaeales archaeon]
MHTFDGSQGEGGGAVLRLVTSLAIVKQESVKITNIRKKRPKPGLQTQHLVGLRALAEFCGGELKGDSLGSDTISFIPSNSWKKHLKIYISTAGSIGLVLQSLQLAILGTRNHSLEVEFHGGATFGKWAPSLPYVNYVTWEIFRTMNFDLETKINRHGFFPKGGANITANLRSPSILHGLNLVKFKKPKKAQILSYATKHLKRSQVAERQADVIVTELLKNGILSESRNKYVNADNAGSGVLVFSKTGNTVIGGDYVGERKIPAEQVGQNAFQRYIAPITSCCTVDPLLADQILPIMATAANSSTFSTSHLSNHTTTNVTLIQDFLGINISTQKIDNRFIVSVDL